MLILWLLALKQSLVQRSRSEEGRENAEERVQHQLNCITFGGRVQSWSRRLQHLETCDDSRIITSVHKSSD